MIFGFAGQVLTFCHTKYPCQHPCYPITFVSRGFFFHLPIKSSMPLLASDFLLSPTNENTGIYSCHTDSYLQTTMLFEFLSQQRKNNEEFITSQQKVDNITATYVQFSVS
jgi:hypothetical protein